MYSWLSLVVDVTIKQLQTDESIYFFKTNLAQFLKLKTSVTPVVNLDQQSPTELAVIFALFFISQSDEPTANHRLAPSIGSLCYLSVTVDETASDFRWLLVYCSVGWLLLLFNNRSR
jgi:hypothetical protein